MPIMYPSGYSRTLLDIDALFARHHVDKMHPEYARRLRVWLEAQNGTIGIGGSWRATGSQPDKPGFAPEGRSFHQFQSFASGLIKFAAVDLVARNGAGVHRSPRWDEVPAAGSDEARRYGVHCNISSEPWHMQPVELRGWASWVNAGRPDPVAGYAIPGTPVPHPPEVIQPPEPPTEDDMYKFVQIEGFQDQFLVLPISHETKRRLNAIGETPLRVNSTQSRPQLEAFFGYELTPE